MIYHVFFATTHYICESYTSALALCRDIGACCIVSDNAPVLPLLIVEYRSIL